MPALEAPEGASVALPDPAAGVPSALELLLSKGRVRATIAMLGPAFIASIAYVDPGNFATNLQGGAQFGYLLLWVVLLANVMAMLVQYLSAKLGIVTDLNYPEVVRERFPRTFSWGMWVQAEIMAMSTDIAEFLGAAIGMNLLFNVPLLPAGLHDRRPRVRDPRTPDTRLSPLRARDHRAAGDHLPRLPLRDTPHRSIHPRLAEGLIPGLHGTARSTSLSGSSARP